MLSFLVATPSYTLTSAPRAPVAARAALSPQMAAGAADLRVGVLAIQGGFVEHMDALGRQSGVVATEVRTPEELAAVDAIILPGGESTAIGHGLVDAGLLQPLRDFVKEKPAWGVCAGLIMLADSLDDGATSGAITSSDQKRQPLVGGLDVTVRRNAFGRQINSAFRPMEVWDKHADELGDAAYFIRAPAVVDAGSDVEVLARVGSAVEAVPDPSLAGSVCAVRQGKLMGTSVRRRPRPPICRRRAITWRPASAAPPPGLILRNSADPCAIISPLAVPPRDLARRHVAPPLPQRGVRRRLRAGRGAAAARAGGAVVRRQGARGVGLDRGAPRPAAPNAGAVHTSSPSSSPPAPGPLTPPLPLLAGEARVRRLPEGRRHHGRHQRRAGEDR